MTNLTILSYYRKAAHRAREILKGKIIREWREGDVVKFEVKS